MKFTGTGNLNNLGGAGHGWKKLFQDTVREPRMVLKQKAFSLYKQSLLHWN